jgi:RNA polymerase sigma-70 factor (ECF subfamily)
MGSLSDRFFSAFPADERPPLAPNELEHLLDTAFARGRAAHGEVNLSRETFARTLGERRAEREFSLHELACEDFFLAVACLTGDPVALRTFETDVMAPLERKLASIAHDKTLAETVAAKVRESMFVGTERRKPKLAVYTGQAPLAAWILLVGRRELESHRRTKARELPSGDTRLLEAAVDALDPELATLLKVHRATFEQAVVRAMSALDDDGKRLLRWSVREGLGIDAIAPRLGIDRATVARRLTRIRAGLAEAIRHDLRARLGIGDSSFESLCAAMLPDLDVSLSRVL